MGGGKGGGGKKVAWSEVFTWASRFAEKSWEALKGAWQVITPLTTAIKDLWGYIAKVYDWVKGYIQPIYDFYKDYIKPVLDFVHTAIDWALKGLALVNGKLDELWKMVETDVFGPLNEIRKDVNKLWLDISGIVSIWNKELGEQMRSQEEKLDKKWHTMLDDIYKATIGEVKEYLEPIQKKINEIDANFHKYIDPITKTMEKVEKIIETTFEKPQVLKRETIFSTSQEWGVDLWNDLFSGVTPKEPVTPSLEMVQLKVDPVVDKYIKDIFAEKVEGWGDITQRIDEEIREKFYGEVISRKTEITVPRLSGGAGGGY